MLAVIIVISVTLYKKIANGPVWFTYILHGVFCDKYWWTTLLYVQNYVNPDTIVSHYRALRICCNCRILLSLIQTCFRYPKVLEPYVVFVDGHAVVPICSALCLLIISIWMVLCTRNFGIGRCVRRMDCLAVHSF